MREIMSAFRTVGIVGIHHNPLVAETVEHLLKVLPQWGYEVLIETSTAETQDQCQARDIATDQLGKQSDVVIAVGGDGNLLHAGRILSLTDTPVIGINRGKLGFLTDVSPQLIETELKPLLMGEYMEEHRFLLRGQVNDGKSFNALNDIVLFAGEAAQLVAFEVYVDDLFVYQQRSDGLIVSTPTGSTAYALSAGGPLVMPDLDVTLIVPKYPHNLNTRPLIVDANSTISIVVAQAQVLPKLSFDGHNTCDLKAGDRITINKQAKPLRLLHPKSHDYFRNLRNKLGWATTPSNQG